ncbi:hypothetical protein F2Q69_00050642 [Brassica cretica]|uniref:Uncharacterized protein n=1 Tax=Brassica cretica TaxID=69181 RepID=A0A8S9Q0K0_BRACR|nr:hypothetical protein F2Q69_00050642 [Brassica cretica]
MEESFHNDDASPIRRCKLLGPSLIQHTHTCRWISNAVKRGISDLDLRITMTSTERQVHHHDETLFKCPIPSIVFTSKTLELYIHHKNTHRGGPHDLCHPTIKRITIHRSETHNFNTPNLLYLDYSDILVNSGYSSTTPAQHLDSTWFSPLNTAPASATTVQILHLSSNTVELMLKCFNHWGSNGGFPFFRNLVKLSFECKTKMGWKVLWSLINNSPKLETLILKVHMISLFNYSQGTYDESRRLFF